MQVRIIISDNTDPYFNLVAEQILLEENQNDTIILILWQNRRSVIIGRFQDPWRECNPVQLHLHDCLLARRQTGGGTVFNDHGTLNYSFISPPQLYDRHHLFGVMLDALTSLGIYASLTQKYDLRAHHRKFSGSAFRFTKKAILHHGTILVNTDCSILTRLLIPHTKTYKNSQAVQSHRSPVINLEEINPDINITRVEEAIIQSFQQLYKRTKNIELLEDTIFHHKHFYNYYQLIQSQEWIYGKHQPLPDIQSNYIPVEELAYE